MENVATSMADRVVTGICALAQVPLAVNYLGQEAFGLWMTLSAVVAAMAVADLGLSIGVQNRMADAFGRDQLIELRQVWKTGSLILAGIAALLAILLLPCCWAVDWAALFKISNAQVAASVPHCLVIMVGAFCLGLPLTTAHRLALAVQLGWMANIKSTAQAIVTLALVALAAWQRLDLPAFLLVITLPPAIANLLLLLALRRQLGWHTTAAPAFSASMGREIAGKNLLFTLPQIGATALGVVPSLLLASLLGAAALTPWNLMQRLLGLPVMFQHMFLAPLWPAYTEANARGDLAWVRATYRRSLWLSLFVAILPTLSFALWGRWALSVWSSQPIDTFDPWLLAATSLWTALQALTFPAAALLNAHGWIKGQAIYGTVAVAGSLLLMPTVISAMGTVGVPLTLVIVFGAIGVPFTFWEARYQLRRQERRLAAPLASASICAA